MDWGNGIDDGIGQLVVNQPNEVRFDPSPDSELLKWRDIHEGKTVCIVGNGESAARVRLGQITCHTIGINKAWMLPRRCTYYVMGDPGQFRDYVVARGDIRKLSPLFATQMGPAHATRFRGLPNKDYREFNFDLLQGIHLNNTATSYALHLAVWMGYTTIYLIGIDCGGGHFYGGEKTPEWKFANQREALGFIAGVLSVARPDIEVVNLNMDSKLFAWPKRRFETVFP